ncbi:MAG: hypothetical protein ABR587_01520 [Candidatus Binatia bacterium]
MLRRAKRWLSSRAAVAALSAAVLLVAACSVETVGAARDAEWRSPSQAEFLVAASTARIAGALHQRPQFSPALLTLLPASIRRVPVTLHSLRRQREGSLPPGRRQYRRIVHDDRGDLPA